jgi:hypothetical protein
MTITSKKYLLLVVTNIVFVSCACISAAQENKVYSGPGYEKGQHSERSLSFAIPKGWVNDERAAKKLGLHSVLVPSGATLESANRVITIAFQKKDANKSGLENLKNFVKVDVESTLSEFPDTQFAKWQPSKLDPDKLNFWSMEEYGKKKNMPSPHRVVILDSGDGYFSISVTAETRDDLRLPVYEEFFNTLAIGPS